MLDAINRVGFREVFKLVGLAAASDFFSSLDNTYRIDSSTMWENALSCGPAMESITQKIGRDEQEYCTLGLLRSMGKTLIDICAQKESESCRYPIAKRPPLLKWEQDSFGITNPALAGFLLSTWNYSPETVSAIQSQYGTNPSSPKNEAAIVLTLAGSLAELGRPLHGDSNYWISSEEHSEKLGLTAEDIEDTLDSVRTRL
ncbi:HDOD domain-containing protein [Candidatus Pelagisphaera phototrophica]|uniref:HDOD domain-containing protein n=1 Tax=Candidatus Pelagisphaera phototrophica TaxID=2684113 RepID=UPI0024B8111D|nr:HDOD domain-containing protein [Candidatus Pelagisphaera phototrophica]